MRENLLLMDGQRESAAQKKNEAFKRAGAHYHKSWVWKLGIEVGNLVLRKIKNSKQEPSRKLDATREGSFKVIKAYGNGSYVLPDSNWHILAYA